jgi:hypothetical protein
MQRFAMMRPILCFTISLASISSQAATDQAGEPRVTPSAPPSATAPSVLPTKGGSLDQHQAEEAARGAQPLATAWKGTPAQARALKERVRKSILANEGHVVDLKLIKVASSSKGETEVGIVITESRDELALDTNPCSHSISQFHSPYRRDPTGRKVTCGKKEYDEVSIVQD